MEDNRKTDGFIAKLGFAFEVSFWILFVLGGLFWFKDCILDRPQSDDEIIATARPQGPVDTMNAPICEIDEAIELIEFVRNHRDRDAGDRLIYLMSGGFDPIHPGHIGYIQSVSQTEPVSKRFSVVLVNGDGFLIRKKGIPFMSIEDRCRIVAAIKGVDLVIPFESPTMSQTVCEALEMILPDYFVKGGDRYDAASIPEWDVCQRLGIKIMTGAGPIKKWSSSEIVNRSR